MGTAGFVLVLAMGSSNAFAAKKQKTPPADEIHTSSSAEVRAATAGGHSSSWGLGVAAFSGLTASDTAITGWIPLGNRLALQPIFTIPGTQGSFQISGGSLVKYTLAQQGYSGFHVGGGATFGSVNVGGSGKFGMGITALGGFHFTADDANNVLVNVDFGPTYTLINSNSNFVVGGLSALWGVSLVYLF